MTITLDKAQIENLQAQTKLLEAQTENFLAQAEQIRASTKLNFGDKTPPASATPAAKEAKPAAGENETKPAAKEEKKQAAAPKAEKEPPAVDGTPEGYKPVQAKIHSLVLAKQAPAVRAILTEFGVANGLKLTPEQWAPCLEKLNAIEVTE